MIVIGFTLIGIWLGIRGAGRRGGTKLDKAQWAAGFGIGFAILGLFLTIAFERQIA